MAQPTLLSFNFTDERLARLKWACMRHRIRYQAVPAADQGQTLAALCGMTPRAEAAPVDAPFTDEMILMAGFPPALVNAFLQTWRQAKQPPIRLKAALTPINATWTACKLHQEIALEDAAVQRHERPVHQPE